MIKIKEAIVVEGKYDKIKLSSILEAVIIVTEGFRIYKDKEKLALIRHYAQTTGIIILTDSDSAGFRIRNFIKGSVKNGRVYNVYSPDVYGKESRKVKPSAEGKLGVEGIKPELLLEAFRKAGIQASDAPPNPDPILQSDLFELGLSGCSGSSELRRELQRKLGLPELLSAKSLIEVLNTMMTKTELIKLLEENFS
ncbi:MAG: toprim domain-containing protein [Ruminococcus sp.]